MTNLDPSLQSLIDSDKVLALQRAISRSVGFGVYIARLNDTGLREQISTVLSKELARPIRSIYLFRSVNILDQLQRADRDAGSGEIFSLLNFESLEEESTLRSLNWERAAFQKIQHPMIFWLSEYWVRTLMSKAPDFYDLHSGFYEIDLPPEQVSSNLTTKYFEGLEGFFPKKLGGLSLLILEAYVTEKLRSPTEISNRGSKIISALEDTEKRFAQEYGNKRIVKFFFESDIQISNPDLRKELADFYDHPSSLMLSNFLTNFLVQKFPRYRQEIKPAVEFYLKLLMEELVLIDDVFRDNVQALADVRSVNILRKVETILSQQEAKLENVVFRSLHQLPPPPSDFTGRDQLISKFLKDFESHKGTTISGLTGMGGIGKTALGLAVARQIAKNYPDAQIFLDLKGTTAPLSAVDIARHVILSFEPSADLRALDENNMQAAYQSVLHGRRVLLFFDNARSAEQIARLTPPETCAMLVTSRWAFTMAGLKTHRVDVMEEKEAIDFLLELCPRISRKAAELARACGYLPLSLRIAGSFLRVNTQWKVEKYLEELKSVEGRLEKLRSSRLSAELTIEHDLFATFDLSYNQLQEDQKKNWRALGVFPASFDANAVAAVWELETSEAENLLGKLMRYSLVEHDEISSRYSVHGLLKYYSLSNMNEKEEFKARLNHATYFKDILAEADNLYLEGGHKILQGLQLFDLEWENIRDAQAWLAEHLEKSLEVAELVMLYPDASIYCLDLRLTPAQMINWVSVSIAAAKKLGNKQYESIHLSSLGQAYSQTGDARKAIEIYEQQLVITREIGDRRGEGIALGNLGAAYADLGDARKSIEFYEQALKILRSIGDRRGEGFALGNLGNAYAILGDVRKSTEFYEQRLIIAREIGDRRGEGIALGNLGAAYADLGDARKAIELYEQHLVITREIGDRRGEEYALGNLGAAYADLGEVHKAMEFYDQRLIIAREIGDRRGEVHALGNLGAAHVNLGDTRKSIEFYEQALKIAREIGDRRGEVHAVGNLGAAYADLGDTRKSIEFYEQALKIAREIGDRRGEGNALFNMGLALYKLDEHQKAIESAKAALAIYEAIESPQADRTRAKLDEWHA